jgi:hypothetical protein
MKCKKFFKKVPTPIKGWVAHDHRSSEFPYAIILFICNFVNIYMNIIIDITMILYEEN